MKITLQGRLGHLNKTFAVFLYFVFVFYILLLKNRTLAIL